MNLRFTLKLKSAAILGKASVRELRPSGKHGPSALPADILALLQPMPR